MLYISALYKLHLYTYCFDYKHLYIKAYYVQCKSNSFINNVMQDYPKQKHVRFGLIKNNQTLELQLIQSKIYTIRGYKVMIDFDLAEMYGIETNKSAQTSRKAKYRPFRGR